MSDATSYPITAPTFSVHWKDYVVTVVTADLSIRFKRNVQPYNRFRDDYSTVTINNVPFDDYMKLMQIGDALRQTVADTSLKLIID